MKRLSKKILLQSGNKNIVMLLLLVSSQAFGQVGFSGFFDVTNSYDLANSRTNRFQMNQFEIDLEYTYNDNTSIGGAVAYNSETGNMELAVANIHYNLWGSEDYHPRKVEESGHLALNVGQNDIPFGLDYLLLASPDRTVLSQPIIVEKTIGGWNDVGIHFHGIINIFTFDLNVVNGFNNGFNLGGKFNISPFDGLSLGMSHASDFATLNDRNNLVTGADIIWGNDILEIKSEYLWATGLLDGEQDELGNDESSDGFYVQGIIQTENFIDLPLFITLRYGQWNLEGDRNFNGVDDSQERLSLGFGYQIMESFSLRTEFLYNKFDNDDTDQSIAVQAVVTF
ncbi:MAG: hypothetical protein GY936_04225 [Ignavibacteriae bacterium]|nr:hypothetical protein [Ignavibacteriota bacterium]